MRWRKSWTSSRSDGRPSTEAMVIRSCSVLRDTDAGRNGDPRIRWPERHWLVLRWTPLAPCPLGKRRWMLTEGGGRVRSSVPVTNRRRILCVFPSYTPAFGTFNHAYKLMNGVRAFMPPQGLLLIAAYMPETLAGPLHRREHRAGDRSRFRLGRRRAGQRHAHPGRADPRHHAPRARGRQGRWCWAGRRYRRRPRCIRTSTICTSARWATPPTRSSRCSTTSVRGRRAQMRFETKERLPLHRFPDPGLRPHPARTTI